MDNVNRRSFMKHAGAAAVAAGAVNLNPKAMGANERVQLGLVGCRARGFSVAKEALRHNAAIQVLCDIDDAVLEKVSAELKSEQEQPVKCVKDYRELLDNSEIDGVIFGTPDHWHAIQTIHACQAGKDIYVEKPLSHTIHEGQQMLKAARKHKRVVQVGTHRRSQNHFKTAVETILSGKLGDICLIKAWGVQLRKSIGTPPDEEVPSGVDYDRWLGPAPERPFNPNRFHYNWRFFYDYGNTELGNQGVHFLDLCLWAISEMRGIDNCLPTRISGNAGIYWLDDAKEVPDTQIITYDYGDLMLSWELRSFGKHSAPEGINFGLGFYGTEGALIADSNQWCVKQDGKETGLSDKFEGGSHAANFIDCIKSRKRPNADIAIGRLSTTLCHLGNIASRLGRNVDYDPETETFGEDDEANGMMTKEYREPYALPEV